MKITYEHLGRVVFRGVQTTFLRYSTKRSISIGSKVSIEAGAIHVDPKMGGVAHRMFVPNGTINGIPVRP